MADFRVYIRLLPPVADATTLALPPAETHHLVNVNRARVGDPVVAFDGSGREWSCVLERVDGRKTAVLRLVAASERAAPRCKLMLAQGLPKGGTMDDIVRQATELGAAVIAPLATTRSELHLDADRAEKKIEKWSVAAIEAAKQCGNPFLPLVAPVQSLSAFLKSEPAHDAELKLVASLHPGAKSLRETLANFRASHEGRAPRSAAWLIGPEGDLTSEEVAAALAEGWTPVSLGPLVLRCDTAAAYALSALRCETE